MRPIQTYIWTLLPVILAAASPTEVSKREPIEQISPQRRQMSASMCAEEVLCCNSVTKAGDPTAAQILSLLGIGIAATYTVGLSCSPIFGLGLTGGSCAAQPVCCWWGAEYSYLVAIDCTPVVLGL